MRPAACGELPGEGLQQPDECLVLLPRDDARVEICLLQFLQIDLRAPLDERRRDLFESRLVGRLQQDLAGMKKRDHVLPHAHGHGGFAQAREILERPRRKLRLLLQPALQSVALCAARRATPVGCRHEGAEWILLPFRVADSVEQTRPLQPERESRALRERTFVIAIHLRRGKNFQRALAGSDGITHGQPECLGAAPIRLIPPPCLHHSQKLCAKCRAHRH